MPVTKSSNGKYKVGSSKPVYKSKKKAENALSAYYTKKGK